MASKSLQVILIPCDGSELLLDEIRLRNVKGEDPRAFDKLERQLGLLPDIASRDSKTFSWFDRSLIGTSAKVQGLG